MSDSFFRKAIQDKMGEGSAQPGNEMWDSIEGALAHKRAAIKKNNKLIFRRLLPVFLLTIFGVFYLMNDESGTTKTEEESIPTIEIENLEVSTNKVQIADNQLVEKKNGQFVVEKETKESKSDKPFDRKEEMQNELLNSRNNILVNRSFKKLRTVENQQLNDSRSTASQGFANNDNLENRQKLNDLESLTSRPQFLEISKVQPKNKVSRIAEFEIEKDEREKQKFSIGINYGINQLEYCFEDKATNETAQLKLGYRFHKYLSAGIGLGFHNVNYDFEVNSSEHIASFGDTDKYPSFHKLKNDVAQIESRLSYFTLPVSLNFQLPITKKITTNLAANQDFAYSQDQLLIYSFKSGADDLEFRETNSKMKLGFTTFRLGFDYPIMDGLKAEVGFNRIITFKTLGIERQYYHGFGGDFGLRYDF